MHLKIFCGVIKDNDGGEFNYDVLEELLLMSQCFTSITIIKNNKSFWASH
jgi:hypothetical protein